MFPDAEVEATLQHAIACHTPQRVSLTTCDVGCAFLPFVQVRATLLDERPIQVAISCEGVDIVKVPQRDLFSKYGWPAEEPIIEALTKFKADSKSWLGK